MNFFKKKYIELILFVKLLKRREYKIDVFVMIMLSISLFTTIYFFIYILYILTQIYQWN